MEDRQMRVLFSRDRRPPTQTGHVLGTMSVAVQALDILPVHDEHRHVISMFGRALPLRKTQQASLVVVVLQRLADPVEISLVFPNAWRQSPQGMVDLATDEKDDHGLVGRLWAVGAVCVRDLDAPLLADGSVHIAVAGDAEGHGEMIDGAQEKESYDWNQGPKAEERDGNGLEQATNAEPGAQLEVVFHACELHAPGTNGLGEEPLWAVFERLEDGGEKGSHGGRR